jgi:peptidyl-prolyl cis-trans isomerase C
MRSATKSRTLAAVLFASLAVLVASCDRRGEAERPPEPGDAAVARVEGETVWASDVKREAVAQGLVGEGEPLDATSDLFRRVLDQVIDQKLLAKEAVRRNLDDSPAAQRRLAAARERILGDLLVETTVDNAISEDAVKALYDEQLRLAKTSEEFRARLILVRTAEEGEALKKLLAAGASFEALAMERSTDTSTRFNGGDLGYFTLDVMPQSYATALKDAKAGETVGPFETEGGFALLRVEDRRQEDPVTLDEARPQILRFLTYDEVRQLIEKQRGKAKIEILVKGDPLAVPGAPKEPASAAIAPPPPPGALKAPEGPALRPTAPAPAVAEAVKK